MDLVIPIVHGATILNVGPGPQEKERSMLTNKQKAKRTFYGPLGIKFSSSLLEGG
jgi:hypothetical protein